jgi:dienelactone hydrolase
MNRNRPAAQPPSATGREHGLAWAMWEPDGEPLGGIAILHGAGSRKENHFPIAREFSAAGVAAICFDQRGHGESDGPMDGRLVDDAVAIASLLPNGPVALRGSSMGGWVALAAADGCGASALMVICPTTAEQLSQGIRSGRLDFDVDPQAVTALLERGDPPAPGAPTLLMHAAGDEIVQVERSRRHAPELGHSRSRYLETPGGHHRSLQHDPEMVALGVRFISRELRSAGSQAEDG